MTLVRVWLAGPWWHSLTYESDGPVPSGCRVAVPVGRSVRIGLVAGPEDGPADQAVKKILRVIDPAPTVAQAMIPVVEWAAGSFFCSPGDVIRQLLPGSFWKGEPFPEWTQEGTVPSSSETFYDPSDEARFQKVVSTLTGCSGGAIVMTPELETAKEWARRLSGAGLKKRLILWPKGAKAIAAAWKKCLGSDDPIVIGSSACVMAPLRRPELCAIEGESLAAYVLQSGVGLSVRSLAARRFHAGGKVLLLGRMPSSRVFCACAPREAESSPDDKAGLRFVSLFDAARHELTGFRFPFSIGESVLSDTKKVLRAGKTVLWLLDRRGEAGEIRCLECDQPVVCGRCGAGVTLWGGRLVCPVCRWSAELPDACPHCGGRLLQSRRPGLEALLPIAQALAGSQPVVLWHQNDPSGVREAREKVAALAETGGLVLGSRRALSLLSKLDVPLVCWLDADAEARQPDYASRAEAYSMILESMTRGRPKGRDVVLQTRSPQKGWQITLKSGWKAFWIGELKERRELGFPPYSYFVTIDPAGRSDEVRQALDDGGFSYMESDEKISLLAERLAPLHQCLAPLFSIGQSRKGFPKISLRLD